jgi:hypothetical protein
MIMVYTDLGLGTAHLTDIRHVFRPKTIVMPETVLSGFVPVRRVP